MMTLSRALSSNILRTTNIITIITIIITIIIIITTIITFTGPQYLIRFS